LDAYTIRSKFPEFQKSFKGLRVAIVGDILHSRVARSNVLLLTKLGASVTLVAPPTLIPVGVIDWDVKVSYDLDSVLKEVDVLMMLRVQSERMANSFFPSEREYSRGYGLDSTRLNSLSHKSIVMHPGPMNRGFEISAESADSLRSVVLDQVANGVLVRMAVLYQLLGGAKLTGEAGA
jgi:aspartate carbamoyltransferase catalytic subunit